MELSYFQGLLSFPSQSEMNELARGRIAARFSSHIEPSVPDASAPDGGNEKRQVAARRRGRRERRTRISVAFLPLLNASQAQEPAACWEPSQDISAPHGPSAGRSFEPPAGFQPVVPLDFVSPPPASEAAVPALESGTCAAWAPTGLQIQVKAAPVEHSSIKDSPAGQRRGDEL